jgi:hypothetical protein
VKKPEVPKALNAITDVVLAYRPKPKTSSSKKRSEKAENKLAMITRTEEIKS